MMDDISQARSRRSEDLIEAMKGPERSGCTVIIEGRLVPRLTMHDSGEGEITLVLNDRLAFPFPREVAMQAAHFAATAMAIGAGYGSIGHCDTKPPFAPKVMQITLPEGSPA